MKPPTLPLLAIVVPCYNEASVLLQSNEQLLSLLALLEGKGRIGCRSFVLYVDDGSRDETWRLIAKCHRDSPRVMGLRLGSNAGQQNALMAGLQEANRNADLVITLDADLQDDLSAVEEMLLRYEEGHDIVYGVRNARPHDSFWKKNTALLFYKLMTWMGIKTVFNHADYRLMSHRAISKLSEFRERNLFLRGIIPLLGYRATSVYYSRNERKAGESHYPISRMVNLAVDGITNFSVRPLRLITGIGFSFLFFSIIAVLYTLVRWASGNTVIGWASLMISIWFLSSAILIALGTVGEYVGKIYTEVKHRPRYTVEQVLPFHPEEDASEDPLPPFS